MPVLDAPFAQLDLMAALMQKAAMARGIPTAIKELVDEGRTRKTDIWLNLELDGDQYYYSSGTLLGPGRDYWDRLGRNVNHDALLLLAHKYETKVFLDEHGFSVPFGLLFRRRTIEKAFQAYDRFSGPICVKPNYGSLGKGVHPSIRDRFWYEKALRRVAERYRAIVVEDSVEGEHFRFFYVEPEIVGIRYGIPMSVVGDGVSTVAELAAVKNAERQIRALPTHPPYPIDETVVEFLGRFGHSLDDVPAPGERIYLSGVSNGPAGADTLLLWDEVHPSYRDVVAEACQAVPGLRFAGVDVIIADKSQPAAMGNHWFLEINVSPAISGFYYPWEGEVVDIAGAILDMLLKRTRASG